MVPSSNVLIFFLLCMAAYGETRTISSTANSTDLDSETSTGETDFYHKQITQFAKLTSKYINTTVTMF